MGAFRMFAWKSWMSNSHNLQQPRFYQDIRQVPGCALPQKSENCVRDYQVQNGNRTAADHASNEWVFLYCAIRKPTSKAAARCRSETVHQTTFPGKVRYLDNPKMVVPATDTPVRHSQTYKAATTARWDGLQTAILTHLSATANCLIYWFWPGFCCPTDCAELAFPSRREQSQYAYQTGNAP